MGLEEILKKSCTKPPSEANVAIIEALGSVTAEENWEIAVVTSV